MEVRVIGESGYAQALFGLGLSRGITSELSFREFYGTEPGQEAYRRMTEVAKRLAFKGGSHSKFLRFITVWLDVVAPRYWWQEEATYQIGVSRQSESTVYSLTKRELTQEDFEAPVPKAVLSAVNYHIRRRELAEAKAILPESFLQRRVVVTNYATLQRMVRQRRGHPLREWAVFMDEVLRQVKHPEFLREADDGEAEEVI